MPMPLVSIIIPCYKIWCFIEDTIASAKAQTYSNIEIIVINDGCTSRDSVKTMRKLNSDGCVKLMDSHHQGLSVARNTAIQASKGHYIVCLDADDLLHQDYIRKAVAIMESQLQVGLVAPRTELFGDVQGLMYFPRFSTSSFLIENYLVASTMFRRSDWQLTGGFDSQLSLNEDYEFFLSIIKLGRAVYQLSEVSFFYRRHPQSICTNAQRETAEESRRYILRKHYDFYMKHLENLVLEASFERAEVIRQLYSIDMLNRMLQTSIPIPHLDSSQH